MSAWAVTLLVLFLSSGLTLAWLIVDLAMCTPTPHEHHDEEQ